MRLAIMIEPQFGLSYLDQLAVAQEAERLGFDALFRSDHYGANAGEQEPGSTDAWAALAGLARETRRIGLGTLVSPATFRPAAVLAKSAATVAEMAGARPDGHSRLELGMGTGWMESEHRAHGFPFGDWDTRFRRLEEQLQVVRGLLDPDASPFSFAGEHEHLEEAVFAPTPEPAPRLLVGGKGPRRTPALAAQHADELNVIMLAPEDCAERRATLDARAAELGRPAPSLSLMTPVLVGRTQEEVHERAGRLLSWMGSSRTVEEYLGRLAEIGITGTPDQAVDRLRAYRDAGVERVMLQHLLHADHDHLAVLAHDVAPALG